MRCRRNLGRRRGTTSAFTLQSSPQHDDIRQNMTFKSGQEHSQAALGPSHRSRWSRWEESDPRVNRTERGVELELTRERT